MSALITASAALNGFTAHASEFPSSSSSSSSFYSSPAKEWPRPDAGHSVSLHGILEVVRAAVTSSDGGFIGITGTGDRWGGARVVPDKVR